MAYPTNKVSNIDMPFSVIVRRADPDFERARTRDLFYDFPYPGRHFFGDPTNSGAYNYAALATEDFKDMLSAEDGVTPLVME